MLKISMCTIIGYKWARFLGVIALFVFVALGTIKVEALSFLEKAGKHVKK
jgi:hypothetical protein